MSRVLVYVVRAYQLTIGMLLPKVCRFEPTCSTYAIEAFQEHGFFRGLALSLYRILRCNPFCHGGWDPVPKRMVKNG
ncbi:MAG: membrane protein insertion efficiency factor YidD [candidate division WOR-3 bacterium]|nr:MAG: membrane protein insertion efficiency factor YidD [candidate division WOR-3 bacterium]